MKHKHRHSYIPDIKENPYQLRLLFPTCIHEYNYEEFDAHKLIDFCYEQKSKNPEGQVKSNRGGWHSQFFNVDGDDNIISKTLRKGLGRSVFSSLSKELGVNVNYWIMINPPNTYNTSHTHPDAHLSGVMWIKTPENCGNILFNSPFEFSGYSECASYLDEVREHINMQPSFWFTPMPGKMLTFPSALRHEVKVNESDEDRIAVSYNIRLTSFINN